MSTPSKFLKAALQAVEKSSKIILQYYQGEIRVSYKEDKTPVTIADQKAERAIVSSLRRVFPHHGFLGEEEGEKVGDQDYQWIIDPIDGTKNFVRGIPIFATQLALLYKGEIILGVSNAPALKECLWAERGKGAYCGKKRIMVSQVQTLQKAQISFGGLNHFSKKNLVSKLVNLANHSHRSRGFGDFWMYHLLAQGKIDLVVEAHVQIWDIAALTLIAEEAGGKVTDLWGRPVDLKVKTILAANKVLHNRALKFF